MGTILVTQPAREGIERPSAKSAYFAARTWGLHPGRSGWVAGVDGVQAEGVLARRRAGGAISRFTSGARIRRCCRRPCGKRVSPSPLAWWLLWRCGGMLLSLRRIGPTWPLLYVLCYCLGVIAVFCRGALPSAGAASAHSLCRLWAVGAVGLGTDELLAQLGTGVGYLLGLCVGGEQLLNANGHGRGCGNPLQIWGNAYAEAGDKERALAAFERAVAEDPEYWQAWLNLGGVKAALGDLVGGEEIFGAGGAKSPSASRAVDELGACADHAARHGGGL